MALIALALLLLLLLKSPLGGGDGGNDDDKNLQTCRLRVFIVSFGALISHKKIQHDSSTPSWSKFAIKFTMGITKGNEPKNRISLNKPFLMVIVQI